LLATIERLVVREPLEKVLERQKDVLEQQEKVLERQKDVLVDALFSQAAVSRDVPRYVPGLRVERWPVLLKSREHKRGFKEAGKPYWELEAAFLRDLEGSSSGDVADVLELTDHLSSEKLPRRPGLRPIYAPNESRRSRSADRYVTEGRKLFAALGAWPWAHAEKGRRFRPPTDWRDRETFQRPFWDWHHRACVDALLAWEAARTGELGFPKVADFEAARHLYKHGLAASPR
jgi:hypothetical protein